MSQMLTAQNLVLHDICNHILEIDNSIRFAGFANNMGTVIAAQQREALLMVSFDNNGEGTFQESIILNGIIPLVSYYLSRVSLSQST